MSGFDDGYNNLMRPGDGNWTAWRNGGVQRHNDAMLSDMAARNRAATDQFLAGMNNQSAGPIYGGGAAPLGPRGRKILWRALAGILIIIVAVRVFQSIDRSMRAARKAERVARTAELQRVTDATWQPRLRQALQRFDVRRDLAAIDQAINVSPCYRTVITQVVAGRQLGFVDCPRPMSFTAPFQAHVQSDRFSVNYLASDPTIRTRMNVMPVTSWSLRAGPAMGDEAPVKVAIDQLGSAAVTSYVGQGCIAIDARRYASNQPAQSEQRSATGSPSTYASLARVTIACPSGEGRFRVAASRVFSE
jgi:hypothetical protein